MQIDTTGLVGRSCAPRRYDERLRDCMLFRQSEHAFQLFGVIHDPVGPFYLHREPGALAAGIKTDDANLDVAPARFPSRIMERGRRILSVKQLAPDRGLGK